jgi:5'-nucleotidase
VSEENGVLISTIMRQYFMSLKVLGKWTRWTPSLRNHWSSVQAEVSNVHPCYEPKQSSNPMLEAFKSVPRQAGNARLGVTHKRSGSETPLNGSDTEDEEFDPKAVSTAAGHRENELVIMRKVMRKWSRIAGLKNHPGLCDSLGEGEFTANWTKAIAPRLEGRIRQTGVTSH